MTLVKLRAQLALWRRRNAWRQRRLDIAHQVNNKTRIEKWERLRRTAGDKIHVLGKQIAAKQKLSSRAKAVAWAKGYAGHVRESPPGSNGGGIITVWQRRLGFGRVPWCGVFCGNALLAAGVRGVSARIASVGAIEQDARAKRGCFRGWTTRPQAVLRGDLVVLFGYGIHVELVESVDLKHGVIHTIGGNTSSGTAGNQSNGGGVYCRVRPLFLVRGFALVNHPN